MHTSNHIIKQEFLLFHYLDIQNIGNKLTIQQFHAWSETCSTAKNVSIITNFGISVHCTKYQVVREFCQDFRLGSGNSMFLELRIV